VSLPDAASELLHKVDQQTSGRIRKAESVTNPASRGRDVISSLIEEAITSSQLEGASTSRRVAKEMLRTGRPPRDRSERMISNNYHAMQYVATHRANDHDTRDAVRAAPDRHARHPR
jgi:Fic family protein